ncbi:DUF2282 domain-containing protein [Paucibacter sp. B2R-40]|uniref:BufA1 family periplasmic bufferin-type metallophore n=1 Tax=Paucibacter sp. B2R-40 TaxID=2893554 RepID=UPI002962094D|nr:DUF2282 domain-containing protein [Paucibacter sp. B2R-40]
MMPWLGTLQSGSARIEVITFFPLESFMKSSYLVSSAVAAALAMGLVGQVAAQDKAAKEKCFGIAKAGENDCSNLSGSHSCAGQSKVDMGADEWKFVAKGSCKGMSGMTAEEAKAKMKK